MQTISTSNHSIAQQSKYQDKWANQNDKFYCFSFKQCILLLAFD